MSGTPLDRQFVATLQKSTNKGGWTCVVMPNLATFLRTRGLVKVPRRDDFQSRCRSAWSPQRRSATSIGMSD